MKETKRETVNKKGTGKLAARFVNQLENRCKLLHITCGRRGGGVNQGEGVLWRVSSSDECCLKVS